MAYKPNFNDPRIIRRVKKAIGFVTGVMSEDKQHQWSTRYIDNWLGQQQHALGQYLREQLLTVTDDRWSKDQGLCKQYILNKSGRDQLLAELNLDTTTTYPIVLQVAGDEYNTELATGEFTYNDKSNRLWHPLQNWRKEVKVDILNQSGYKHHYDIQCCALTLIHQWSQQQGMDLYLFALHEYLRNRTAIRKEIAQQVDIPAELVKRIINALLAGAQLSRNQTTQIYQMLEGDVARIEFLQQHQFLTELRADFKTCWDYIKPTMARKENNKTGRLLPISSRQKWGVYFDLERRVLNEVRSYMDETGNRYFLEHDGWSCQNELDVVALTERVSEITGFNIKLESK